MKSTSAGWVLDRALAWTDANVRKRTQDGLGVKTDIRQVLIRFYDAGEAEDGPRVLGGLLAADPEPQAAGGLVWEGWARLSSVPPTLSPHSRTN